MDVNPLAVPDDPTDEFEPLVVPAPEPAEEPRFYKNESFKGPPVAPFDDGLPPVETGGSD